MFKNYMNAAVSITRSFYTNSEQLWFRSTYPLWAEPLRKKKRIDPQVMRERAEKKIRRIQRDIRRLEKVARQFKPLSELEQPKKAMRDSERTRPPVHHTEAEINERRELRQMWSIYKKKEHIAEMQAMQKVIDSQEKALDALQEASPELYEAALQPLENFIPFQMKGPSETPPIKKFDYPDGDFIDCTKVYQPIIPTDPKKLRQMGLHKKKL